MYDRSMLGSDFIPVLVGSLVCVVVAHLATIGFALYRLTPRSVRGTGYLRQKRTLVRLGVLSELETADAGDVGELVGTWRRVCVWATIGGSIGGLAAGALVIPLAFSTPRDPSIYGSAGLLHWLLAFLLVATVQALGLPIGRYAGFMVATRHLRPLHALAPRPGEVDVLRLRDVRSPKLVWFGAFDLLCLSGLTAFVLVLLARSVQQQRVHEAFTLSASIVLAVLPMLAALGLLASEFLARRLVHMQPFALTPDSALAQRGFERLRQYQLGPILGMPYMALGVCALFEMVALLQVASAGFIDSSPYWLIMFGFLALYVVGFGVALFRNGTAATRLWSRTPSSQAAA